MLEYFEKTTEKVALSSGYERIGRLHEIVAAIKASDEIGVKYMNAYEERMHDIQEAREQGEEIGRSEGLEQGRLEGLEEGRTEGLAEGEKIGEARGEASGRAAEKLEMAKAMKSEGIDINTIVKVSGLPLGEIEKL